MKARRFMNRVVPQAHGKLLTPNEPERRGNGFFSERTEAAGLTGLVVEGGERRTVYKYVNGGGTFGANPLRQTIGLGRAERIEKLEIFWPTTNQTRKFTQVALDAFIQIVEGSDRFNRLEVQPCAFAVSNRAAHSH